jgi:recombination protein RecT
LGALFTAAQLGVEPIAGRAYILPFNNSRKQADGSWKTIKEAQFIMGYRGVADLFYRHEKAVQLDWGVVHKHDTVFEYEYGTEARLRHVPAVKDRGPVTHYYVVATLNGGGKPFMVMSYEDCIAHGQKHSKTYDKKINEFFKSSPWVTAEDSMCLKTVLIQLAKLLPLSVDLQRAIAADETSREFRRGIDDALDLPTSTMWADVEAQANAKIEQEIKEGE